MTNEENVIKYYRREELVSCSICDRTMLTLIPVIQNSPTFQASINPEKYNEYYKEEYYLCPKCLLGSILGTNSTEEEE